MKRRTNRDGFTVMEVMIALVILSIGLLGLVTT
ncbi:MAG: type IV pilus modification PilV family protein, partial [Gemmatimonadales bacterium]